LTDLIPTCTKASGLLTQLYTCPHRHSSNLHNAVSIGNSFVRNGGRTHNVVLPRQTRTTHTQGNKQPFLRVHCVHKDVNVYLIGVSYTAEEASSVFFSSLYGWRANLFLFAFRLYAWRRQLIYVAFIARLKTPALINVRLKTQLSHFFPFNVHLKMQIVDELTTRVSIHGVT